MNTLYRMKTPGHLIVSCYLEESTNPKNCSKTTNRSNKKSLISRLGALCQRFFRNQQEPYIWQSTDRWGNNQWHVYDPDRDRSLSFITEEEIREWLDVRHYSATGTS